MLEVSRSRYNIYTYTYIHIYIHIYNMIIAFKPKETIKGHVYTSD
jgi:hypothetical protein